MHNEAAPACDLHLDTTSDTTRLGGDRSSHSRGHRFDVLYAPRHSGAFVKSRIGAKGNSFPEFQEITPMKTPTPPLPSLMDLHPLPETPEAISCGCICTLVRRVDGTQLLTSDGRQLYSFQKGCPVHH